MIIVCQGTGKTDQGDRSHVGFTQQHPGFVGDVEVIGLTGTYSSVQWGFEMSVGHNPPGHVYFHPNPNPKP